MKSLWRVPRRSRQKGDIAGCEQAVAWLREHARACSTTEPGGALDDLVWLRDAIGGARLVALGEATHGTHEFFTMKHRLLRFLVEEMGFRAFAIEASWSEANLVNDYVRTGEGDPRGLLYGLGFWTWYTQEVLDLIVWVREHNLTVPPDQAVSFFGFDVQYPRKAIDNVVHFLDRVDPAARAIAEARYAILRQDMLDPAALPEDRRERFAALLSANEDYLRLPGRVRRGVRRGLRAVHKDLTKNRLQYVRATSCAEFEHALRSARMVLQSERLFAAPTPGRLRTWSFRAASVARSLLGLRPANIDWHGRDKAMAEMVSWLLEQGGPDGKMVLWAHNGHVMTFPGTMGNHLRKRFRDQLRVAAFAFHHGSFRAITIGPALPDAGLPIPHAAGEKPERSYEAVFRAAGRTAFIADLRGGARSIPASLRGPRPFQLIGAGYSDAYASQSFRATRLPREADLLIYIEESTPSAYLGPHGSPPG